ncbi:AFT1 [Candida jiufengensis]|uniref:AFT1 n=1 Tax=Candida jiufengensis TaxID=497108 RepID=UPI0022251B0E|nr:AFT1 [Candida jiufengensis]KAI5952336.1 AFT1 [Candida jiufengensis]
MTETEKQPYRIPLDDLELEKQRFIAKDDIKPWLQDKLLNNKGIHVVIERSDTSKIIFKCKNKEKKTKIIESKNKKSKIPIRRHTSCPFKIRANFSLRNKIWSLSVINDYHDHIVDPPPGQTESLVIPQPQSQSQVTSNYRQQPQPLPAGPGMNLSISNMNKKTKMDANNLRSSKNNNNDSNSNNSNNSNGTTDQSSATSTYSDKNSDEYKDSPPTSLNSIGEDLAMSMDDNSSSSTGKTPSKRKNQQQQQPKKTKKSKKNQQIKEMNNYDQTSLPNDGNSQNQQTYPQIQELVQSQQEYSVPQQQPLQYQYPQPQQPQQQQLQHPQPQPRSTQTQSSFALQTLQNEVRDKVRLLILENKNIADNQKTSLIDSFVSQLLLDYRNFFSSQFMHSLKQNLYGQQQQQQQQQKVENGFMDVPSQQQPQQQQQQQQVPVFPQQYKKNPINNWFAGSSATPVNGNTASIPLSPLLNGNGAEGDDYTTSGAVDAATSNSITANPLDNLQNTSQLNGNASIGPINYNQQQQQQQQQQHQSNQLPPFNSIQNNLPQVNQSDILANDSRNNYSNSHNNNNQSTLSSIFSTGSNGSNGSQTNTATTGTTNTNNGNTNNKTDSIMPLLNSTASTLNPSHILKNGSQYNNTNTNKTNPSSIVNNPYIFNNLSNLNNLSNSFLFNGGSQSSIMHSNNNQNSLTPPVGGLINLNNHHSNQVHPLNQQSNQYSNDFKYFE